MPSERRSSPSIASRLPLPRSVEGILHRFFNEARLDVWFETAGQNVAEADEWFDVPLLLIDELPMRPSPASGMTGSWHDPAGSLGRLRHL